MSSIVNSQRFIDLSEYVKSVGAEFGEHEGKVSLTVRTDSSTVTYKVVYPKGSGYTLKVGSRNEVISCTPITNGRADDVSVQLVNVVKHDETLLALLEGAVNLYQTMNGVSPIITVDM